ncbi:MAG: hypothetical protein JWO85_3517 [Candidatus Eremiobacteraeota bacterium]|nr:hypothetical protein [Candidatus Eremiobacteraeota bacterium]
MFELRVEHDLVPPPEGEMQWVPCRCFCAVDSFQGEFPLSITEKEFARFRDELNKLRAGDVQTIELENLEMDFRLIMTLRHTGSVSISGKLAPGYVKNRATLTFDFDSDIANIDTAARSLSAILKNLQRRS